MLRTAWFYFVLLLSTVWYGTRVIVASWLGVRWRPGGVYDYASRRWARNALWAAGARYQVVGLDRLPRDRPVVIASNHQSWFDIFLLNAGLPGSIRFVSKKELRSIPVLGRAMEKAGHIFLDRRNRQAAFGAYEEAADDVRRGITAIVFPEGTRSRTGDLQVFKKGPFVLAIAAHVPLVPAYCAGTIHILRKGGWKIESRGVALMVGRPIETSGMTYDDRERLAQETRQAVEALRVDSARVLN